MTNQPDPDDVTADEQPLLDELRTVLGSDPLPTGLVERAEQLAVWFDVDDELVAVQREQVEEPVGVRGGPATGLAFATADNSIEIQIEVERRRVVGHLVDGDADTARLLGSGGDELALSNIDDLGQFEFVVGHSGPCRVQLSDSSGVKVTTDWFVL